MGTIGVDETIVAHYRNRLSLLAWPLFFWICCGSFATFFLEPRVIPENHPIPQPLRFFLESVVPALIIIRTLFLMRRSICFTTKAVIYQPPWGAKERVEFRDILALWEDAEFISLLVPPNQANLSLGKVPALGMRLIGGKLRVWPVTCKESSEVFRRISESTGLSVAAPKH